MKHKLSSLSMAAVMMSGAVVEAATLNVLELPSSTNIVVEAGDTLRVEFMRGGKNLYKSGEGRLEVAVIENQSLEVVVSNGTFASVMPTSLDTSGDENVVFHLDANASGSISVEQTDSTNFVTKVVDCEGRTGRELTPFEGRPMPIYAANGINGLPAIDLGSLHNRKGDGYGAALCFDEGIANAWEVLYVFEDDPNAKYREKSIGPCFYGSAGDGGTLVRGYVEAGTNAPLHYTASIPGRTQDGNYIDGERWGTTKALYYTKTVPDGPHVLRNKIAQPTSNAYDEILGLGYFWNVKHPSLCSLGGLKIGEVIFLSTTTEYDTISDTAKLYQTYLMRKWLDAATVGKVTLLGDSHLDVSGAPFKCQVQWSSQTAVITGVGNLLAKGYYEAGNPPFSVEGEYSVSERQTVVPGLEFGGNAEMSVAFTATVARVDGQGTFVKKGTGHLLLGAHDARLTALDVREGSMKVSPLEASGAYLHVDASATDTMTLNIQNGTNFVTKWVDVNNGVNFLQKTTTKYQFANRSVGVPYISEKSLNGLPLMDFGVYTSELYKDGNGGAFVPNVSLSREGANAPAIHNMFVVWGDYDEIADLPLHDGEEIRGPGILAAGNGWGYRGYGGGGNTCPILGSSPNGTYHSNNGSSIKIDGVSFDFSDRPSKGMHVLDQKIGALGAELNYVGGCKWQNAYVGGGGSGVHPGVWGGVRMGEILIYRNILPEYFRERIAAALGTKWFNRVNSLSYASIAVAEGSSLEFPDTCVVADSVSMGGSLKVEELRSANISVTDSATVAGDVVIADGGMVSFACGKVDEVPSLSTASFNAEGSVSFAFAFGSSDYSAWSNASHLLVDNVSSGFSLASARVKLPAEARAKGMRGKLELKNGSLYCSFYFVGFSVIVR